MKKYIIILILIALTLTGCGMYNLNSFVLPDDLEFIQTIEQLDTPEKIGQYMENNFEYDYAYLENLLKSITNRVYYTAYKLWETKKGTCQNFAFFGIYIAHYHGYEVYSCNLYFYEEISSFSHAIAIYKENDKYNYSCNQRYYQINADDIDEIVEQYVGVKYYRLFRYNGDFTEVE